MDSSGGIRETESRVHRIKTSGFSQNARLYIILLILILLLLLLLIICVICMMCCRNKGQKYPVSKKERLQGRDNILAKDRGFADYGRKYVLFTY